MNKKKIGYVGPSWAVRSFDVELPGKVNVTTNLLNELGIEAINLAKEGASNSDCYNRILEVKENLDGIIWIYCEPILDVYHDDKKDFLINPNFWKIRKQLNEDMLSMINNLNIPTGIIGAHSDIVDCNYPNIEVIHPSWQKFLAEYSNVALTDGWGAEVLHRWQVYEFPGTKISREAVGKICELFASWTQLEINNVFYQVHPNRFGNEIFAKEIRNSVSGFLNNI